MRQSEAAEWAEVLSEYERKCTLGRATFKDANAIVQDLVVAIGREAEESGWYCDWERMMGWAAAKL